MLVDQGMSSVSNVLAIILVARSSSAAEFGRFAVTFTALTVALQLSRSFFGVRVSLADDVGSAHTMTKSLGGALVLLSPLVALAVLVVSLLAVGTASLSIVVIGACVTPVVLVQDIVRYGASASDRPVAALASDTVWVAIMAAPFVAGADLGPTAAVLLWAAGAVAAMGVAIVLASAVPALRAGVEELRRRHRVGESVTIGSVIALVGVMWTVLVTTWFIGPAAAGALRGATTTMGPANVLTSFSALGLTPALVRRPRTKDVPFCASTSVALGGLTALWGLVLLVLPTDVGQALLGESWAGIRGVLPWTIVEYTMLAVAAGAFLGLKVRHRGSQLVVQRAAAGFVTIVGGTVVAVAVGQTWAVAAVLALAALVSAAVGWTQLLRDGRRAAGRVGAPLVSGGAV